MGKLTEHRVSKEVFLRRHLLFPGLMFATLATVFEYLQLDIPIAKFWFELEGGVTHTNYIKYVINSEALKLFNSRRIDEGMVTPLSVNAKRKWNV